MRYTLMSTAFAGETLFNWPGPRARETSLFMQAQMHPAPMLMLAGAALAAA